MDALERRALTRGVVTFIVGLVGEVADVRAWHLSETGYEAAGWVVG